MLYFPGTFNDILPEIDVDLISQSSKNLEEETDAEEETTGDGRLVNEETQDTGVVKLHVYSVYWKAVGSCLAPAVLLSLLLMQSEINLDGWMDGWVVGWTDKLMDGGRVDQLRD